MRKFLDWLDDRTGFRALLHVLVLMNFPVSRAARWRYVWGGALALMFVLELVTGTLLMTVYSPSETSAWGSVRYIESSVRWGSIVRGLHHYTSHMMLIVTLIHLAVVTMTAGYRKPKEFTFWSGLVFAGIILGLAISGNPLPWDQKGYWAYEVETGIMGTMPVVGSVMRTLLVGGGEFGNLTLTRLYTLHVMVLPLLGVLLLMIHVALMRREKLQLLKLIPQALTGDVPGMEPYWPYQTTRNLLVFVLLMGLVFVEIWLHPLSGSRPTSATSMSVNEWEPDALSGDIFLEAPADPRIPYVARPEWYVRFLFELRHMVPKKEQEIYVTGLLPIIVTVLLFLMPYYEKVLGRRGAHFLSVSLTVLSLAAMGWLTYYGYSRDRLDAEYQRTRRREIDYAGRAIWLAGKNGIPPNGPVTLLAEDAKAMGPLLFAANCATCHRWNGHDGTGKLVVELKDNVRVPARQTASDLHMFATRSWLSEFLRKPTDERFFGNLDLKKGGDKIKHGSMTKWTAETVGPHAALQEPHIHAVAALVSREAHRREDPIPSPKEIELGVSIFNGGFAEKLGKEYAYCLQCHNLKAGDPDGTGSESIVPAPDLNGYGSRQWLLDFIRHPADKRFYGKKNIMPPFDRSRLSDKELELLVDWMRGEWQREQVVNAAEDDAASSPAEGDKTPRPSGK